MAKIEVSPLFESVSGKLCYKNPTYIALNRHTGKMYSAERHVINDPNTALQQAVRTSFTQRAQVASVWWRANRPTKSNPDGTADYQQLLTQYKAQHKYGNIYTYLRTLVQEDLSIKVGGTISVVPSKPDTPPSSDRDGNDYEP